MTEPMVRGDGDEVMRSEVEKFRAKVQRILANPDALHPSPDFTAALIADEGRKLMLLGFAAGHGRCWQDHVMPDHLEHGCCGTPLDGPHGVGGPFRSRGGATP